MSNSIMVNTYALNKKCLMTKPWFEYKVTINNG